MCLARRADCTGLIGQRSGEREPIDNRRAGAVVRKIVTAVVVTVAAVAGPGLSAGAGATARAPEVGGIGAGGAVTHARPLERADSLGMSRALASSGDRLWLRRFHPPVPGCGFYFARSVAVSPGGDAVFVTGYCGLSRVDYFTVAY